MEKRNYSKKHITQLKSPNNQTITDRVTILNEEKYFYEHLYKSENPDIENAKFDQFFQNKKLPELDDKLNKECEGNLTMIECRSALKEFQADKTPATDGFTAEFYKYFWEELCEETVESFIFLFKALKTFNFGSDFISWVQTFYGAVQSCVINNGLSSQMFNIERGVRQGCMSPVRPSVCFVHRDSRAEYKTRQ